MVSDDDAVEAEEVSTLLRAPRFDPTPLSDVAFEVTVVAGPDHGKAIRLSAASTNRLLVGASPACDLVLSDREVSRRHLALELDGRRVRVTDLGSSNGTTVHGVAVVAALLAGGEDVHLGGTTLRLDVRAGGGAPVLPLATGFGRV
ncbi:MAG TPA: FHA domain-containing protein, partial [Polyangiaceae bacterium]